MAQESMTAQPSNKVDAKEDLVFLTSGAKEKLSKTIVGASETAYKMMHPFNKEARDEATEKAKALKREVSQKQEGIRIAAHQQAEAERWKNANPDQADHAPLVDGTPRPSAADAPEAQAAVPPHMRPSPAQPSQEQSMFAAGSMPNDSNSGWSSDGSSRAGIAPTAAGYRSA